MPARRTAGCSCSNTTSRYAVTAITSQAMRKGTAALALTVTARAAVPFLIAWEVMAVTAYLLVVLEHEHPAVRRAGMIYVVATHAGTLLLFVLFAAWAAGG